MLIDERERMRIAAGNRYAYVVQWIDFFSFIVCFVPELIVWQTLVLFRGENGQIISNVGNRLNTNRNGEQMIAIEDKDRWVQSFNTVQSKHILFYGLSRLILTRDLPKTDAEFLM